VAVLRDRVTTVVEAAVAAEEEGEAAEVEEA
jgi:hypothetical protein